VRGEEGRGVIGGEMGGLWARMGEGWCVLELFRGEGGRVLGG